MTVRTATLTGVQKSFRPVLRLWGLRLLLDLDGHRYVMDQHRVTDSFTLAMLGMDDVVDMSDANLKDRLDALWRQRKTMKLMAPRIPRTSILGKNIAWLAKTLSLNVLEGDIIGFLALAQQNMGLERLLEKFGALRTSEVHMVLATVLGHPTEEIARALHHAARLIRSNLVWTQGADKWSWSLKLGLLAGIGDLLALEHADPFDMFASNFRRCPSGPLDLANYPHLEQDLRVLEPYLRQALLKGHHGVNVLLYGPPGTGKTELAKALARAIGAPLFEVASEDRNGNVIKGEARFGAFQLAQGVLGGDPRPVLLFDEVEDVFQADEDGLGLSRRRRSGRKAWVNNMLSQNAIPAIWVTNVVAAIDPAYLRRFDYVLEVGVPPRSVRANILEQYTKNFRVSPGWQTKVATQECLTPAAIERAAKVTRVAISVQPDLQAEGVMSQLLNNGLALLGEARMPSAQSHGEPPYRHDLVNADSDLGAVALGLKGSGVGRLCLYGPPGTGKTAWGRHLAQVLDRPLHVHRGSDLLSPYVGETEAKMARMFRMAEAEGALLLLDEADSFFPGQDDDGHEGLGGQPSKRDADPDGVLQGDLRRLDQPHGSYRRRHPAALRPEDPLLLHDPRPNHGHARELPGRPGAPPRQQGRDGHPGHQQPDPGRLRGSYAPIPPGARDHRQRVRSPACQGVLPEGWTRTPHHRLQGGLCRCMTSSAPGAREPPSPSHKGDGLIS